MPEATVLDQAVANAAQEHLGKTDETKESVGTGAAEAKTGTATTENPRDRDARLLYDALENPNTSKDVVKELARRAGLRVDSGEARTPQAAATGILEDLKEGIAPEYHFLIDNLAPAIQKLVKKNVDEGLQTINQRYSEQQVAAAEKEVEIAYTQMCKDHPDFKTLEPEIAKLSKRLLMSPGTSSLEYMQDLYAIASKNKSANQAAESTVRRVNRNLKEDLPSSAEVAPNSVKTGSKLPSLNESIKAAMRGEKLEE